MLDRIQRELMEMPPAGMEEERVELPPELEVEWAVEDAAREAQEAPEEVQEAEAEVREVEKSVKPLHGRPYETGTGHADLSELEPDLEDPAEEVEEAVERAAESAGDVTPPEL